MRNAVRAIRFLSFLAAIGLAVPAAQAGNPDGSWIVTSTDADPRVVAVVRESVIRAAQRATLRNAVRNPATQSLTCPHCASAAQPLTVQPRQSVLGRGTAHRNPDGSWRTLNLRPRTLNMRPRTLNLRPRTAATRSMTPKARRSTTTARIAR